MVAFTNIHDILQECHVNLALCLIRQGLFEDAIGCLTALLHYAPQNVQAYYLRGKCFLCLQQHETAITDLRTASEVYRISRGEMSQPSGIEEVNMIDELVD